MIPIEASGPSTYRRRKNSPPSSAPSAGPDVTRILCGLFVVERAEMSITGKLLRGSLHLAAADRRHNKYLLDEIGVHAHARQPGWHFRASRLLELLLADTFTDALSGLCPDEAVGRAVELIDHDPTEPWTIERLARRSAMSPSSFAERFRIATGVTPMRYVLDRRMALSAQLLAHDRSSVETVGHQVGFSNQPALTRAFKRHFGVPPSHWRSSRRRAVEDGRALTGSGV